MPRKAFVSDLQAGQESRLPQRFSGLKAGEEDGSFVFSYQTPGFGSQLVHLQALVTDVSEYPSAHSYFVYTISENTPEFVNDALLDNSLFDGLKILQLISKVARALDDHTRGTWQDPVFVDSGSELEVIEDDDDSEHGIEEEPEDDDPYSDTYDDEMYDDFGVSNHFSSAQQTTGDVTSIDLHATEQFKEQYNARIRSDLYKLKAAGFRVSCCTSPFDFARDFYMTASCRIAKLNISEDALAAWDLSREKYIILLFHYTNGYKTLEEVVSESESSRYTIQFKVTVSKQRKGALQDTIDLFSIASDRKPASKKPTTTSHLLSDLKNCDGHLEKFFIDRPLNELLNGRFVDVLRLRETHNFSWDGAERFFQKHQSTSIQNAAADREYFKKDVLGWTTRPSVRVDDHFAIGGAQRSFPLIAMEFMLRHLIHCTNFCLVCHTIIDKEWQAIKPYVCDNPLCLYQYMALGFGPSIEHEIITQPYVVDLLVSFCYARASSYKLSDLPVGMGLSVPDPNATDPQPSLSVFKPTVQGGNGPYHMDYYVGKSVLVLPSPTDDTPSFRVGDWVWLKLPSDDMRLTGVHRKVVEIYPSTFHLARVHDDNPSGLLPQTPPVEAGHEKAMKTIVFPMNHNFDDLSQGEQRSSICHMLDILPPVSKMKAALLVEPNKPLASLFPDVSPSSLGILRWIIASNRSCIVALDDPSSSTPNSSDRVYGMGGYMQFRFAQGAPDKEQRFMEAINNTQERLKTKCPTLWAWHGSDIGNWHSIIREGLHFKSIVNGRAYGNGIYMSLDARTSQGYTAMHRYDGSKKTSWPQSELNVSSALSLNEVVNAPKEFVSSNPHLVVQHLDWVQTRILFVKCDRKDDQTTVDDAKVDKPRNVLQQDAQYFPFNVTMQPLLIPASAISASRRRALGSIPKGLKGNKLFASSFESSKDIEDVLMSDADDEAELALVYRAETVTRVHSKQIPKTDFVPGSLDLSKLPRLPSPPYATTQASRALTRALKDLQKMQISSQPAELGWHLCEEALDNIYQWIVELHTFESDLPIHKDLKSKGLISVVLELQFGPSFPFSPPFVRVIQPRFLGFQQGGGGHVTLGGALCMELLTNDGWSAVSSIEAVLLQVKMAISSTDPRPARLPPGPVGQYDAREAIEAYRRACAAHGWKIPPDLQQIEMASSGQPN